ncbi:DUF4251 domain-containing protein [Urechidicola vernalis]|uniref:DUF4251 domain-containing protein n=1 Tax=Urechidicola vernalis TaxID=3075600 RepID=A0ABU2Y6J2_9FLAO|nr:DUF4251 domain-containing protein [Urechidicola sp. P050]MDT0553380.1 DUF4251 domain-containing protein [Urechidicola sp. P050]
MKKVFLILLSFSVFGIQTINAQSKKELKQQQKEKEYSATKEIIESGNFVFVPDWVNTQKGRRVNITGDGNTLKIEGKKSTSDLPFFGVSQTAHYSGNGGIVFTNSNTEFSTEFNDKKSKIIIKFKATEKSETFDIHMEVFSNGNATVRISSSSRNSISYNGKVTLLEDKKDN